MDLIKKHRSKRIHLREHDKNSHRVIYCDRGIFTSDLQDTAIVKYSRPVYPATTCRHNNNKNIT